jgi:hypothetical protein
MGLPAQVGADGGLLRLQAKPGLPLPGGRDPVIGNESAGCHGDKIPSSNVNGNLSGCSAAVHNHLSTSGAGLRVRLAALRHLLDWQITGQVIPIRYA